MLSLQEIISVCIAKQQLVTGGIHVIKVRTMQTSTFIYRVVSMTKRLQWRSYLYQGVHTCVSWYYVDIDFQCLETEVPCIV